MQRSLSITAGAVIHSSDRNAFFNEASDIGLYSAVKRSLQPGIKGGGNGWSSRHGKDNDNKPEEDTRKWAKVISSSTGQCDALGTRP